VEKTADKWQQKTCTPDTHTHWNQSRYVESQAMHYNCANIATSHTNALQHHI